MFHRITDIGAMRAPAFARLAMRIGAYTGAVTARYASAAAARQEPPQGRPRAIQAPRKPKTDPTTAASAEELRRLLRPAPGIGVWGEVREVKPADG